MNQFYPVNYLLEQQYFVEKTTFLNGIDQTFEYLKNVKLISRDVEINANEQNVWFKIEIKIAKNVKWSQVVKKIEIEINDFCYSLINVYPTNLKLDVLGVY